MQGMPEHTPYSVSWQMDIRIQRPNLIHIEEAMQGSKGRTHRSQLVCDGKSLWEWSSQSNIYMKRPAPPTLKGIPAPSYIAGMPGIETLFGENEMAAELKKKLKPEVRRAM